MSTRPSTRTPTTYARARLHLGMTGVGLFVIAAVVALVNGWPARAFPTASLSVGESVRWLVNVVALYALLQVPLDLLGGFVLPKRFGRVVGNVTPFALRWGRGVLVQGIVIVGVGVAMLTTAQAWGTAAGWATGVVVMVALVALQARLAKWVGDFGANVEPPAELSDRVAAAVGRHVSLELWPASDEGFTGGWFGLPGRETLVLPARWVNELSPSELDAVVVRRAGALATSARTHGVVVALAFNAVGLFLAALLPGAGFGSVAALVTTMLGVTLWSFLGVLVLPSVSRRAALAIDVFARRHGVEKDALAGAIRRLDRWQDDEPVRAPIVETIFHPVPSVDRRLAALDVDGTTGPVAWHAARMMLFTSWASLGLLSRAVHCNVGRPQLWAALPAD